MAQEARQRGEDSDHAAMASAISVKWRALSEEERQQYALKAANLRWVGQGQLGWGG